MKVLKIYKNSDPELRQVCKDVEIVDDTVLEIAANMWATMSVAGGCGLAANQVGIPQRIVCVKHKDFQGVMVNPTWSPDEKLFLKSTEGCLSIPGKSANKSRYATINARYLDLKGEKCEIRLNGFAARIVQHETEHLDGILMTDEVENEK